MQKVVGSSPIIRSQESPVNAGLSSSQGSTTRAPWQQNGNSCRCDESSRRSARVRRPFASAPAEKPASSGGTARTVQPPDLVHVDLFESSAHLLQSVVGVLRDRELPEREGVDVILVFVNSEIASKGRRPRVGESELVRELRC